MQDLAVLNGEIKEKKSETDEKQVTVYIQVGHSFIDIFPFNTVAGIPGSGKRKQHREGEEIASDGASGGKVSASVSGGGVRTCAAEG